MRVSVALLLLAVAVAVSEPINRFKREPQRIVGGSTTTINVYPFAAALLYSSNGITYWQSCGGAIINNRSILSAAHCFVGDSPNNWRIRVGSTYASSGGVVHFTQLIINHNQYNANNQNNDVALLRSSTNFAFSNSVAAVSIAGSNYNLGDNQVVWAIGWGAISFQGPTSEQLRHVQIWTVNQNTCVQRYAEMNMSVNNNMLCSGWLDVGGRDQCQGDSGSPLLHNNVVVGVCSWGLQCALPRYPGVNARVSQYTSWIQSNA